MLPSKPPTVVHGRRWCLEIVHHTHVERFLLVCIVMVLIAGRRRAESQPERIAESTVEIRVLVKSEPEGGLPLARP